MCPLCWLFEYRHHRTEESGNYVPIRMYGQIVNYEPERVEWERRICGVCGAVKERQRKAIRILNEVRG